MYKFKILTEVDSSMWDNDLTKSNYATFFQTTNYLNSNSNDHFSVFIYILDKDENVVGQLGLRIIKTVVRYSSPFLRRSLHLISSITSRGIWLDGPIIHSNDKNIRLEILQKMMEAINVVADKYDLVHIEGYTSGYDTLIDDNYKEVLSKNNFIIQDYVTFILDMKKNIDDMVKFEEYTLKGKSIISDMITSRELHVAVPLRTTLAQWQQIEKAMEYAGIKGVLIKITKAK